MRSEITLGISSSTTSTAQAFENYPGVGDDTMVIVISAIAIRDIRYPGDGMSCDVGSPAAESHKPPLKTKGKERCSRGAHQRRTLEGGHPVSIVVIS